MSGNFDDIEMTARKSAFVQNRMSYVAHNMYKQFVEYQQSNSNTAVLFDRIAENAALAIDYFKQSFNRFGIPSENIYADYDKQRRILFMNILWHSITFAANMKDKPKALERTNKDMPPLITGRIIAAKGAVPELKQGFTAEAEQKLLDMEAASLFIPADTSAKAVIKAGGALAQELLINQQEAPREFLFKVIERVCGGGNCHKEGSRVTISI